MLGEKESKKFCMQSDFTVLEKSTKEEKQAQIPSAKMVTVVTDRRNWESDLNFSLYFSLLSKF